MNKELKDASYEMVFCGNYLVQHGAVFNWSDDKGTQRYMLKEMLAFADRVKAAADTIRAEIEKGSAD